MDPDNGLRSWLHPDRTEHAVVLLHGFTNNSRQWDVLGAQLFADGCNVIAPSFPYHGFRDRRSGEIAQLQRDDVVRTAREAVGIAAGLGEKVAAVGFSMGGVAAVWAAATLPIYQAIAISPCFRIRYFGPTSPALRRTLALMPNIFLWWNPFNRSRDLPPHTYPTFSTHATSEILYLDEPASTLGAQHAERLALVLHPREPFISNSRAIAQCRKLERAGLPVTVEMLAGLPALHDIIEPQLPATYVDRVYPVLRELLRRPVT